MWKEKKSSSLKVTHFRHLVLVLKQVSSAVITDLAMSSFHKIMPEKPQTVQQQNKLQKLLVHVIYFVFSEG